MPKYSVVDPSSGRKLSLEGDSPPTESELNGVFGALPSGSEAVPTASAPKTPAVTWKGLNDKAGELADVPEELKQKAVLQSYIKTKLPEMDDASISGNWGAVKTGFAKSELGIEAPEISDEQMHSLVHDHEKSGGAMFADVNRKMAAQNPDHGGVVSSMLNWFEERGMLRVETKVASPGQANAVKEYKAFQGALSDERGIVAEHLKPSHYLPEKIFDVPSRVLDWAEKQGAISVETSAAASPDKSSKKVMAESTAGMLTPDRMNGIWSGFIMPTADFVASPEGIALAVASGGIGVAEEAVSPVVAEVAKPLARLVSTYFAWDMANAAAPHYEEMKAAFNDPNMTDEQKSHYASQFVGTAAMSAMAGLHALHSVMPKELAPVLANKLTGNPAQDAKVVIAASFSEPVEAREKYHVVAGLLDGLHSGMPLTIEDAKVVAADKVAAEKVSATEVATIPAAGTKIVSAAIVDENMDKHTGANHDEIKAKGITGVEGFIDENGTFHSRKNAGIIARVAGQVDEAFAGEEELHSHHIPEIREKVVESESKKIESSSADDTASSIKRASVDTKLKRMGLEPLSEAETLTNAASLKAAEERAAANPQTGQNLVNRIKAGDRKFSASDVFDAQLHSRSLLDNVTVAEKRVAEAVRSGDEQAIKSAELELMVNKAAFNDVSELFMSFHGKGGMGTEAGRMLQAFKTMLAEDYSVEALNRKYLAASKETVVPDEIKAEHEKTANRVNEINAELKKSRERPSVKTGKTEAIWKKVNAREALKRIGQEKEIYGEQMADVPEGEMPPEPLTEPTGELPSEPGAGIKGEIKINKVGDEWVVVKDDAMLTQKRFSTLEEATDFAQEAQSRVGEKAEAVESAGKTASAEVVSAMREVGLDKSDPFLKDIAGTMNFGHAKSIFVKDGMKMDAFREHLADLGLLPENSTVDDAVQLVKKAVKERGLEKAFAGFEKKIKTAGEKARAEAAKLSGRSYSGIDPEALYYYGIIAAEHVSTTALKGAQLLKYVSDKMVAEFGESVIPYVKEALADAREHVKLADLTDELAKHQKYIENRLAALEKQNEETKKKISAGGTGKAGKAQSRPEFNEELEKLSQEGESLRAELKAIDSHNKQVKELQESIDDKSEKIKRGDIAVKSNAANRPSVKEVELLKQERDSLQSKLEELRKKAAAPTAEEVLQGKLDAINERTAKVIEKVQAGDIAPAVRTAQAVLVEILKAKANLDAANKAMREVRKLAKPKPIPKTEAQKAEAINKRKVKSVERRMAELEKQIKNEEVFVDGKPKKVTAESPELIEAKKKLKKLEYVHDNIREKLQPKEVRTEEDVYVKQLDKEIEEIKRQIRTDEVFAAEKKIKPDTERVRGRLDELKALEEERANVSERIQPSKEFVSKSEKRRIAAVERIKKEVARLKAGEEKPVRERHEVQYKPEDVALIRELADLKAAADRRFNELELARRTPLEKLADGLQRFRKVGLISGIHTLAKVTAAGQTRIISTVADTLAGEFIKRLPVISEIAKGAPREGGMGKHTYKSLAEGYVEGWMMAIDQAKDVVKSGVTAQEIEAGSMPTESHMINYYVNLHSLAKLPAFAQEYKISLKLRTEYELSKGTDMTHPIEQMRVSNEAVADGLRAKLSQDNFLTENFRALTRSLENAKTHQTSQKIISHVLNALFPIVKISANWIAEGATYSGLGLTRATVKTLQAMHTGIEKMSVEEKESVMRHWKKGSVGAGLMLIGFFNADNVGGYYQPGKKQKDAPEFGGVRLWGHDVPLWMVHMGILEPVHIGATIKHVMDGFNKKSARDDRPVSDAALAGIAGLIGEVPYVGGAKTGVEMLQTDKRGEANRGKFVKGTLVPKLISEIAEWTDPIKAGRKRETGSVVKEVASGIPFWRETLKDVRDPNYTLRK